MTHSRLTNTLLLSGIVAVALAAASTVPYLGVKALALGALPLVLFALENRRVRAVVVVFGGLVSFQSSAGISGPKGAYLCGLIACAAYAVANLGRHRQSPIITAMRAGAGTITGVIAIGMLVGVLQGHVATDVVRDSLSYVLLALVPLFAADIAPCGSRFCHRLLLAASLYGTLGFFLEWSSKRGLLSVSGIGLASLPLVAAGFAYLCALGFTQEKAIRWFAAAALALAITIATATRSAALMLVIPLAIAVIPLRGKHHNPFRLLGLTAVVAAIVGVGVASHVISGAALQRIFGLNGNTGTVQSDAARLAARANARALIGTAPVVGHGLGTRFQFEIPYAAINTYHDNISTDTFLTTIAKFGWIGALMLCGAFIAMLMAPVRHNPRSPSALALMGLLPFLAVYGVIASPFDDKGLAFAVLLLATAAASETPLERQAARPPAVAPRVPVRRPQLLHDPVSLGAIDGSEVDRALDRHDRILTGGFAIAAGAVLLAIRRLTRR